MTPAGDPPRVEFRVRDLAPPGVHDRQQAIYDELLELEEDGYIADVTVEVWGKQVRSEAGRNSVTDDTRTSAVRSVYEEFEAWAEQNGHTLEPAFSTRTVGSGETEEPGQTVIRFPVMCLAVYDGDELLTVAPCSTEEGVRTIDDCLEALLSGELITAEGIPSE